MIISVQLIDISILMSGHFHHTPKIACTLTIPDKGTATASLPVTFTGTGEAALTWIVRPVDEQNKPLPETDAAGLSDRVESRFPVTFPAPLLRERHTFVLDQSTTWDPAGALTPELQQVKD